MKNTSKLSPSLRRVIWAGVLGNCLELYDFALYGFFAAMISTQFFPSDDPHTALLSTFGIFAAGFLARPIGAIFLGRIGDRYGRKRALEISILLMSIPTALMAFLPPYRILGLAAPLLLLVLRILQGISVAGELVGSYTYLLEHAPHKRRSYVASWSAVGAFAGKLIAIAFAAGLSMMLTTQQMETWGWRLPFIVGLGFAGGAYRLRRKISETPEFQEIAKTRSADKTALKTVLRDNMKLILYAVGCIAGVTVSVYTINIYLPVFMVQHIGISYSAASISNFLSLMTAMLCMPIGGLAADHYGRERTLLIGVLCMTASAFPAFYFISTGSLIATIIAQAALGAIMGGMHGSFPAMFAEIFPTHCRCTASAVAYNIGVGVFGGMTPLIATGLVTFTNSLLAPAGWLMCSCIITSGALLVNINKSPQRSLETTA